MTVEHHDNHDSNHELLGNLSDEKVTELFLAGDTFRGLACDATLNIVMTSVGPQFVAILQVHRPTVHDRSDQSAGDGKIRTFKEEHAAEPEIVALTLPPHVALFLGGGLAHLVQAAKEISRGN